MKIINPLLKENIRIGLGAVRGNLLRSILTMIIISIGITALVGILTAIDSIKYTLTNEFTRMGANTFTIRNRGMLMHGQGSSKPAKMISYREAMEFKDNYSFNSLVSIYVYGTGVATVKYKSEQTNPSTTVMGCDENYMVTSGYEIESGRNFSHTELEFGSSVAIIGSNLADVLFKGGEDPIGKFVSAGVARYRVIGVLKERGSSMGFSGDNNLFIPVDNIRRFVNNSFRSYMINVKSTGAKQLEPAIAEATVLFRNIRRLRPRDEDNFSIEKSDNLAQMMIENLKTISLATTFISLMALLGAAIGLMNIMLVSVTERTREIGVRKALGANRKMIRNQFLVEAIVIGLLGGILGIIMGVFVGNIVSMVTDGKFIIPWAWMTLGVVLCFLVGLASGIYPANKASRLDPIESLRYE